MFWGVSLERISGVFLWGVSLRCVSLGSVSGVYLWSVSLGCVTEECHWGVSLGCVSGTCLRGVSRNLAVDSFSLCNSDSLKATLLGKTVCNHRERRTFRSKSSAETSVCWSSAAPNVRQWHRAPQLQMSLTVIVLCSTKASALHLPCGLAGILPLCGGSLITGTSEICSISYVPC